MKTYKIFKHPRGEIEAVKQGWSWVAFFFTWIWALIKRQWALGAITLLLILIGNFVCTGLSAPIMNDRSMTVEQRTTVLIVSVMPFLLVGFGMSVWFGIRGNKWREIDLDKRGYSHLGTAKAATPDGAVAMYINLKQAQV